MGGGGKGEASGGRRRKGKEGRGQPPKYLGLEPPLTVTALCYAERLVSCRRPIAQNADYSLCSNRCSAGVQRNTYTTRRRRISMASEVVDQPRSRRIFTALSHFISFFDAITEKRRLI